MSDILPERVWTMFVAGERWKEVDDEEKRARYAASWPNCCRSGRSGRDIWPFIVVIKSRDDDIVDGRERKIGKISHVPFVLKCMHDKLSEVDCGASTYSLVTAAVRRR